MLKIASSATAFMIPHSKGWNRRDMNVSEMTGLICDVWKLYLVNTLAQIAIMMNDR